MENKSMVQALSNAGLGHLAGQVQVVAQESIRLSVVPFENHPIPAGISRLGGQPDLPPGTTWPKWKGQPMSFLAQIRLEELAGMSPASQLPPVGLLSFFYDSAQETFGSSPDERGGWQVYYFSGDAHSWQPTPFPEGLPQHSQFTPFHLVPSLELTLPVAPRNILPDLDWADEDLIRYEDFQADFPDPADRSRLHHRMFGHPEQIQDDMQLQCALYANGFIFLEDPKAGEFLRHKSDWLLLLQIDSEEQAGMKWATSGMLYFWIERSALQARQFDRTWMVLQAE